MFIHPMHLIDGYKTGHHKQYPEDTEYIYSNLTPRRTKIFGVDKIVWFGLQYFILEYLVTLWNRNFFDKPKHLVLQEYQDRMDNYLGPGAISVEHIAALHDLGYLPLHIKALPEGTLVPFGIPVLTIINTEPEFYWLTNYFETLLSTILWKPTTSATTAFQFRKAFEKHCKKTGYDESFIQWQGHDFSMRGMSGIEDAMMSGAGHLLSFTGTDTIPAIEFLEEFYFPSADLIGGSVPATEHSVMSLGSKESEIETFRRLITEVYPKGIVSIVSDTWDFWKVMTEYLPALKEEILARDGRVVIRPDSGDPVDIICGFSSNIQPIHVQKGAYELLWDTFGGTINAKGFKELNSKIGLIYGDAITLDRQRQIFERLEKKGFSASNLVLGIGSYTYEYVTRDTYGFAMKATWGQVNGAEKEIFKDPVTDSGFKKSAKGLLRVDYDENHNLCLKDQCTFEESEGGLLQTVFKNSQVFKLTNLDEIRARVLAQLK